MGWIPVQPNNLRLSHSIVQWIQCDNNGEKFEEVYEILLFSDHLIQDGMLISL